MSQSIYSVYGTAIHLLIDDEFAANYNVAVDAFNKAQQTYFTLHQRPWNGEPMWVDWTDEAHAAYNQFAELMNFMIKMNGGSLEIGEDDLVNGYLTKV